MGSDKQSWLALLLGLVLLVVAIWLRPAINEADRSLMEVVNSISMMNPSYVTFNSIALLIPFAVRGALAFMGGCGLFLFYTAVLGLTSENAVGVR